MGETPGGGAEHYYRRYSLAELVAMGFADSAEEAEANQLQWRRLGDLLIGAAESGTNVAKALPDSYQSREGAPALLERLGEASKLLQGYGQVALDNGMAWLAVKQSLEDAQVQLAALHHLGSGGMQDLPRNAAAAVVDKLSLDYINHANEILAPGADKNYKDRPEGNTETGFVTGQVDGSGHVGGERAPGPTTAGPGGAARTTPSPVSGPPGRSPGVSGHRPASESNSSAGRSGGSSGVIGGSAESPTAGASHGPVGLTLGGKVPGGLPGTGSVPGGDASRAASFTRPTTPSLPPGGSPPGGGGRRDRKRRGRRRGGLLGDPNDFRYDGEVVAPPEIHPDEQRPVTEMGKTIGGGRKPTEAQPSGQPEETKHRETAPSPTPLFDPKILPDGDDVQFKMRRRSGA
ncbi:MAG: hypothetical protein ACRDUA_11275 [Micromonosporaceae bacterium]